MDVDEEKSDRPRSSAGQDTFIVGTFICYYKQNLKYIIIFSGSRASRSRSRSRSGSRAKSGSYYTSKKDLFVFIV